MVKQNKEGSLGEKVAATLSLWVRDAIDTVLKIVWKPFDDFFDYIAGKWSRQLETGSFPGEHILINHGVPKQMFQVTQDEFDKLGVGAKLFVGALLAAYSLKAWMQNVNEVVGQFVRYNLMNNARPNRLTPSDAIAAFIRGNISEHDLIEIGHIHGFNDPEIQAMLSTARTLLDPTTLQTAWLRDLISEDALKRGLSWGGYSPESSEIIKKLAYYIPPAQDLIHMAVREAFSPAIASKFGQYEDFPAEFEKFAKQQGISSEWARRYWASHWDLPSLTMGFEMLHRGTIDKDDLMMLMRAQDVMPYWRDKLLEISYNPFTRVDTRRMYKLGILDRAGVIKEYMAQGYDRGRAEKLADFTAAVSVEEDKELTKADILDGYQRKTLDAKTAGEFLIGIGYGPREVDFYLTRSEQKRDEEKKKQLVANIQKRFERGNIDEAEAIRRLAEVNVAGPEIDEYIEVWRLSRGQNVFSIPLGDLKSLFASGVIDETVFRAEMVAKGATDKIINWYIAATGKKGA